MQLISLALLAFVFFGCRTSLKQNVNPSDPILIKIHLNGIDSATIDQFKLTAQLRTCASTSGTKVSGTTYSFAVAGVKKDSICQVQVVGPKSSDAGVQFFDTQADGIYFEAATVTIYEELSGGLSGDAYLEKLYTQKINPGSQTWRIDAAITSELNIAATCTCRIICAPSFANDAAIVKVQADSKSATCTFDNAVDTSNTGSSCSQVVVQCGNNLLSAIYDPNVAVDQAAGKVTKLPPVKVMPATPTAEGDVEITPTITKGPASLK